MEGADFSAFDNLPLPVLLIDENLDVVFVNRKAEEVFGKDVVCKDCHKGSDELYPSSELQDNSTCLVKLLIRENLDSVSGIRVQNTKNGKKYFYIIASNYKDRKIFLEVHVDLEDLTRAFTQSGMRPELMLHSGPVVFFHWDSTEGWPVKFVSVNVKELLGYSAEDFLEGRVQYKDLIHPEDLDRVVREVLQHTESGTKEWNHEEYRLRRKDGKYIWVSDHTTALRDAKGKIQGYFGYVLDVTERHEKEELFHKLAQTNPHAVFLYDYENNKIVYVNYRAQELTGYSEDELLSMGNPFELVHPKDLKTTAKLIEKRLQGYKDIQKQKLRIVTKKGKVRWVNLYAVHTTYNGRNVNVATLVDITEERNKERVLMHLATRDQLTGILNRHALMQSFEQLLSQAERYESPFSVIIFDLDNFKRVNDTHGHSLGDEVLRIVAREVKKVLRKSDIFGRWGGEEFLILLPMTSDPYPVAEKIRQVIEVCQLCKKVKVTLSAGTTTYRKGDSVNSLIARADDALYRAKAQGKNRVVSF